MDLQSAFLWRLMSSHITNHIFHPGVRGDGILYVVGVISNPVRYHSRYRIAREWIKAMACTAGVHLTLVECAYGDRHHELRDVCSEVGCDYVPLRTNSEIWIKENMINLGMRNVFVKYPAARYLSWIDADVFFNDPNWAKETVQQLQHFEVVQPWSDAVDLGPNGNIFQHFRSFGYQHQRGMPKQMHPDQYYYQYAHSGFAWACTKRFWEAVGGLPDFAILGSADHHAAFGMIGEVDHTIHRSMCPSFFRRLREWQARAVRVTKNQVGFVAGFLKHLFHGPKKRRYYRERWDILKGFDPDTDLMYDDAGLIQLCAKPDLEQAIMNYNRSRFEDSIEET